MAIMKWLTVLLTVGLYAIPGVAVQDTKTEIHYYEQDNVTNRVPYFDNRFHIDAQLEEITLLFYRRSGTPPIILVRPDGSKIKVTNAEKGKVEWYDDTTFDMIRIVRPMPGPWQAIGAILPDSKIMIVSEVKLEVEPLADILLSGETLKITSKLYNQEKAIDDPLFNDVIKLTIDFYSTNNTGYDNFGAEPIEIGTFRDDGYELDEYARDGIFTGEFELNFSPGEWTPIYRVIMPMATRELRQKLVIVRPNPISIEVKPTTDPLAFHEVTIHIDDSYVDPDSLIFQGKITYPDRQSEPFAIMEGNGTARVKEIGYTEPGVHRITLNAFGNTKNGREFRLVVPDFTFNVEREGGPLVPSLDESSQSEAEKQAAALILKLEQEKEARELALKQAKEQKAAEAEAQAQKNIIMVIVANVILLLLAGVAVFFMKRKKQ
ncbi:TIGR03503 family protein [Thalassotalea sp. PP2-459]|uniref:TIGR03503 family protein n=1 Tax=Thalassotalea sp. PP2-459 TaxID=1742724 RepID=UPI00094466EE|nr:TIGR03503 family protein [Thalassotalea sp. PP2-459]OKY25567.1 TIGR03503 family protein [Thalassotalea sp. PP2-459]